MRGLVKAIINSLPFDVKYEIFYQTGRALGVTAYQAQGSSGPIFGHLYDQTLIKSYLRDGQWSNDIAEMISAVFKGSPSGGTFYDIGANVGTVILPVSKNILVNCLGFEPDPGNLALLQANTAGATNIKTMRVAVADRKGQMRFAGSAYNSGDHHLSPNGDQVVDVIALDDLPTPVGPIVAKIDM